MSAQTRKGVGNTLAGDGDCSRRHATKGPTIRSVGRGDAKAGVRYVGATHGSRWQRQSTNAITRRVPNPGGRMAGSRVADVQALHTKESSAHSREASAPAIRRQGDDGDHAAGGSGVRGSPGQQRIRTQDNGPHSRRPERGAPHSGQVGPSPGQSCA